MGLFGFTIDSSILIMSLSIFIGLAIWLLCTSFLDHPDVTRVRSELKDMYNEQDKDNFFVSLLSKHNNSSENKNKGIKVSKKFQNEFESAGIDMPAGEFAAIWAGMILMPPLIAFTASKNIIVAMGALGAGVLAPLLIFKKKKDDRLNLFESQLANTLTTICNGLRSGFSFQQAMESMVNDMQPPVAEEFGKALTEINYGVSQHDAIMHIYDRTKCEDIKMLVYALDLTSKTGGNLSDILSTVSDTVRTRIRIGQEVKTLSAQGKMSSLIVGLLPVVLLIMLSIVNPDYVAQLFNTKLGNIMLVIAALMELIGFWLMNKITDVKL